MQNKRKMFSINRKISLVIFLTILFCSVSISVFSYVSYRSELFKAKGENAKSLADSVATYINGTKFLELSQLNEVDDKNEFFNTMKNEFETIRNRTGVFYLYTMIQADADNYKYIVSVNEPGATELLFGTLDAVSLFGDEPMQALTTGKSFATGVWDGELYGFLVSGFSPIMDDNGNVCGVVGVDINVDNILLLVNNFRNNIIIVMLIIALLSLLISSLYFRRTIIKPIVEISTAASKLSEGNLDVAVNITANDELGVLSDNFLSFVKMVDYLVIDFNKMSHEQDSGDFESFIETERFKGSFKEIATGVNNMVKGYVDVVMEALKCIEHFGDGNFQISLTQYSAEQALAFKTMNALEQLRNRLVQVNSIIHKQVESAVLGNLSDRADISKVSGEWTKILIGLNDVLDAFAAPINEAADVLSQVSNGIFDKQVEGNYKGDFLIIKNSINNTVTNISSYIDEISSILKAVSQNDLSLSINREYVGEFTNIKEAINNIIYKFNTVISDILSAASQVASGAQMISESSMTLAQGATEQASAVEELNATIITINQSTAQNADSAKEAENLSAASKDNAGKGDEDMHNMLLSMDGIKESSDSISKIIKVIDDIAFQTNLLALNAAVEAARAGVHGKGFAVVAEEVRNLAGKSQDAAKETADLIEESIVRVNEGAKIASATADALRTIVGDTTKIAGIISNISGASNEQALAISQVMEGISQVAEVVQSNSATSEETASASQQLSGQADVMRNLVSVFKLKRS